MKTSFMRDWIEDTLSFGAAMIGILGSIAIFAYFLFLAFTAHWAYAFGLALAAMWIGLFCSFAAHIEHLDN
jgi:hypothetical protein